MLKRLFSRSPAPAPPRHGALAEGWATINAGQFVDALRWVTRREQTPPLPDGFFFLKGVALDGVGRHEEAIEAYCRELELNPAHAEARVKHDHLARLLAKPVAKKIPTEQRPWNTSLPRETLLGIQQSLHNYHYRGVPMLKNPFDFAIYPMLLWRLKPRTLIEIGSKSGGSALWFGDLMDSFGIPGHVHSVDIVKVDTVAHPRVTFLEGNGRALEESLAPDFLNRLPRPWLVIEDADHAYETSSAVLRFFHPWLRPDDYIVVEDGIISDLGQDAACNSGPHRALKEFLGRHPREYEIDGDYCDFFGYNLTWCTNGFLRKTGAVTAAASSDPLAEIRPLVEKSRTADAFPRLNQLKATRIPVRDTDYLRALCFVRDNQPISAIEALKEELRYFPDNEPAAALLEKLADENRARPVVSDREFQEIFEVIRPCTMVGEARLFSLFNLAKSVCEKNIAGNFVECGVAAGGSSALLAAVIARHSRQPRRLFSFDTFEGMPAPTAADIAFGQSAEAAGWGAGTCAAPEASLREVCRKLGVEKLVEPVKGFFADTLPPNRERIGPIALLHMDGDWYSSTRDILDNLFDQVAPGGRIQIDDYGYWEGCKRAVTEFEKRRGLKFQINVIDETGVWVAK